VPPKKERKKEKSAGQSEDKVLSVKVNLKSLKSNLGNHYVIMRTHASEVLSTVKLMGKIIYCSVVRPPKVETLLF
jgi:hypothetical protein